MPMLNFELIFANLIFDESLIKVFEFELYYCNKKYFFAINLKSFVVASWIFDKEFIEWIWVCQRWCFGLHASVTTLKVLANKRPLTKVFEQIDRWKLRCIFQGPNPQIGGGAATKRSSERNSGEAHWGQTKRKRRTSSQSRCLETNSGPGRTKRRKLIRFQSQSS